LISVLTGPAGLGKSTYTRYLAACVTRGWDMPDGQPCLLPGGVVTAYMEEPLHEVVVPRLRVVGCDLSRMREVSKVPRTDVYGATTKADFSLNPDKENDIAYLEQACRDVGASLVIIDSLRSALGGMSQYNSRQIYAAFNMLSDMAERVGCAILIITHPPKNASAKNPASYIGGTEGIFSRVRIVDVMLPDSNDPKVTMVMNLKNNVSAFSLPLGFVRLPDGIHLDFVHGKTPGAEKLAAVQRVGDTRMALQKYIDEEHDRTFSAQECAAYVTSLGLKVEYGAVRVTLSRMVADHAIQSIARNTYASLFYVPKQSPVTSVTSVTSSATASGATVSDPSTVATVILAEAAPAASNGTALQAA